MKGKCSICISLALLGFIQCGRSSAAERLTVDFSYIDDLAEALATKPYDPNQGKIPDFLEDLGYDEFRDIRFDPQKALWSNESLPFQIMFYHPGGIFNRTVSIHEFTDTHEQEVPFATEFFDYGKNEGLSARIPASLGYAGFKIFCVLNEENLMDEFMVFLGSNYFRALARGQEFGLSARGLAVNTTIPDAEEFPFFRSFWLGKPKPEDEQLVVFALMDSPSLTGAYRFRIDPGEVTDVMVTATLHFRREIKELGFAPLSSMFYFGENTRHKPLDYRNEVHDSDGLLVEDPGNGNLWRPLVNPGEERISRFHYDSPVSFGLFQRDRRFENYQDANAAYHLRPSAWIMPGSNGWGSGTVLLYEFATQSEAVDNVVAMWSPDVLPATGESHSLDYSIRFMGGDVSSEGRVVATRVGIPIGNPHSGASLIQSGTAEIYELVVDFAGDELSKMNEVEGIKPVVDTGKGLSLLKTHVEKVPYNKVWRLIMRIALDDPPEDREISAFLELEGRRLTERWSYSWVK